MRASVLLLVLLAASASAAPLDVSTTVNGVDPTVSAASVTPGEAAEVRIHVNTTSEYVYVVNVVFKSEPEVLGTVLNDFVKENTELPRRLWNTEYVDFYELPGVLPAGEYDVQADVYYSGDETGSVTYEGTINVESTGIISGVLGFLVHTLPGFISEPLAGLFI